MRHLSHILILIALVIGTACSHDRVREQLAAEVAAVQTPVSIGPGGSLVSVDYDTDANTVTFDYVMNGNYIDASAFDGATDHQKRAMASFLQGEQGRPFLDLLDKAGASLALRFTIGSEEPRSISLTHAAIHDIAAETDVIDNSIRQLHDVAALENDRCPTDLGNGLRADSVTVEEKYLTYIVTAGDSITLSTSAASAQVRTRLLEALSAARNDVQTANTLGLLKKAHFGLRYRVAVPADSTTHILDLTPDEIAAIPGSAN